MCCSQFDLVALMPSGLYSPGRKRYVGVQCEPFLQGDEMKNPVKREPCDFILHIHYIVFKKDHSCQLECTARAQAFF